MLKTFEGVDSEALTERLYEIRRQERELLVEFLHTLAEVDARKFYLDMAFPSLFAFLTGHLGCSKAAAFRRSTAARLLVRFPEAEAYLADGRLGLTTFVELRDVRRFLSAARGAARFAAQAAGARKTRELRSGTRGRAGDTATAAAGRADLAGAPRPACHRRPRVRARPRRRAGGAVASDPRRECREDPPRGAASRGARPRAQTRVADRPACVAARHGAGFPQHPGGGAA